MLTRATEATATIVPTLRYRDLPAAIDWLCRAFGFRAHLVERNAQGRIRYAQLTFGDGMVVLGPTEDSVVDGLMVQPGEMGGMETQICYVFAEDAVALDARARQAGATPLADADSGRGILSFRDPEGHIWNFGRYDPWQGQTALRPARGRTTMLRAGAESAALLAGLLALAIAATTLFGWVFRAAEDYASITFAGSVPTGERLEPTPSTGSRDAPDRESGEIPMHERDAKAAAERQAADARSAQAAAELATRHAHERMLGAERTADEARSRLLVEQGARASAEQALVSSREELERERTAREAAERATKDALTRKPKSWRLKKVEGGWTW